MAWQVVESLWASERLALNRFVCEQQPYNLLDRRVERDLGVTNDGLSHGRSLPGACEDHARPDWSP